MSKGTFQQSARERMLAALEKVLSGIDGVVFVSRQAISSAMVSDAQLPAILIEEQRTRYSWQTARAGTRVATISSLLALDLQIHTKRGKGAGSVSESTVRECFVDEVLQTLVQNPCLRATLDEEGEVEEAHARDALADFAEVRYVPGQGGYARALILIRVVVEATYDRRERTEWKSLIVELYPEDKMPEHLNAIQIEVE